MDYDRGLGTLVIRRDGQGAIIAATLSAVSLSQPSGAIEGDRLDIQRVQSAVLVAVDGVDYALVADDNHNFNDPYWRAMFEAPLFVATPSGPPIPLDTGRPVAVGGKLGVVRDPFGAAPVFLGATLPLDGYGLVNLSLSPDGRVLVGQLKGGFGTRDPETQQPHQGQAWNVAALIAAAEGNAGAGQSRHIPLASGAEEPLPLPAGAPVGTGFAPGIDRVTVSGRLGDVIEVDLKRALAAGLGLPAERLSQFGLDVTSRAAYRRAGNDSASLWLVATGTTGTPTNAQLISRDGGFAATGICYLAPNLTDDDVTHLRKGGTLAGKSAELSCRFQYRAEDGTLSWRTVLITVTATDAAHGVFFGDRPLDDPGYSEFTLSGPVGVDAPRETLDVWRVEQRLRYLGFPAMGYGNPDADNNTIQNFSVDGEFGEREQRALKLFEKVVRYAPGQRRFEQANDGEADGATDATTIGWLNAYNAPHWMNVDAQIRAGQLPGWRSSQIGARAERYVTSWTRDLMRAVAYAPTDLRAGDHRFFRFNGGVDANYGYTPATHDTHDLGMAFDLGIRQYINTLAQSNSNLVDPTLNIAETGWTIQHAVDWSDRLPEALSENGNDDENGYPGNGQEQALRDFLSLYAMTQNNSWSTLLEHIVNGDQEVDGIHVIDALFGHGTAADDDQISGLIENVVVGGRGNLDQDTPQNPYADIRYILRRLGISNISGVNDLTPQQQQQYSGTAPGHQNHFHVMIRPPHAVRILEADGLVADGVTGDTQPVAPDPKLLAAAQNLLLQVQPYLELDRSREVTMFPLDLPPAMPSHHTPVLIAQAPQAQNGTEPITRTIGVCFPVENPSPMPGGGLSAMNAVEPVLGVKIYMSSFENKTLTGPSAVTVLEPPKHGQLRDGGTFVIEDGQRVDTGESHYAYVPDSGFTGEDTAKLLVEIDGHLITVVCVFHVDIEINDNDDTICPKTLWKISLTPSGDSGEYAFNNTSPFSNITLDNLNVQLNFASLTGNQVGQAEGSLITLDDDGAGHGWFLDATPESNDEFLPTANPNEWIAKPGSEAAGRMDLLSVLLHEYGHVLGLDHETSAHQLMSEELQPGVRRTVSDEALAGIWAHVRQTQPTDPSAPFAPSFPLGLSFVFGFTRRRVGGPDETGQGIVPTKLAIDPDAVIVPPSAPVAPGATAPRYELATHTGVVNGDFDHSLPTVPDFGWTVTGAVSLASGAAELREHERALSGLSQAFVLPESVAGLRFEITAAHFTANGLAPPDAFEKDDDFSVSI